MEKKDCKILVDAMFGKLGKFLRILGFDTKIADNALKDPKVMQQAIRENRLLITRDEPFYITAKNHYEKEDLNEDKLIYIPHQDLEHQLAVFFKSMDIDPSEFKWKGPDIKPFDSNCTKCNSDLEKVPKQQIISEIPKGTSKRYNNYWRCTNPKCH